jgi:hypothetical protein
MSFLTLSLPKEEATICVFERRQWHRSGSINEGRDAERVHVCFQAPPAMARRDLAVASRIYPYRGKTSCESAAAFFRGNSNSASLFANLVAGLWQRPARYRFGRRCFGTQTIEQIANQPSQTEILGSEILHVHHSRNAKTAEASAPSVEGSQRHPCGTANLDD